jgi:iron complex transport system substrate-binding protein
MRPDLLLEDLISIFHPEILPDHKLVYYRRLKWRDNSPK